ncbi:MAG: N(4)-(beta-N-acetylglucosaminyl)-L-asparaginase [Bacteroidales bacterium]|nr:N(4)-(beta-N-acetylglucosaminyl)-L-asparaginase [Bacteroidales bacterium]
MTTRRKFIQSSVVGAIGMSIINTAAASRNIRNKNSPAEDDPLVISTWHHGLAANEAAWKILQNGGSAMDAVENGVKVSEADPSISSVGYGGLPDSDGNVTLDACVMDETGNAGSVVFLQHIMHPVSVARMVMEKTPHVILAGDGALQFALSQGFSKQDMLTPDAKKSWEKWKKSNKSIAHLAENHDTIGMLAIDKNGNISGACTTSGIAFKMPGRVGDSPIIGAGLYVDNEVGGATATGQGELILKIVGSFLVTELMRNGYSPAIACKMAVERIYEKFPDDRHLQVGFIAVNKAGETGGYSLRKGFDYAVFHGDKNELIPAGYLID